MDFAGGPQSENQRKRKERQVLGSCWRTKKAMDQEVHGDTNCDWRTWNDPQKLGKRIGRDGNQKTNRDHANCCIKIGQNTEKSPGDPRRLDVTQTLVKDHQLTLV